MTSTDTTDEMYIRLIDENGKKSVERHLAVKHIRGEISDFKFCTPRDEDLARLNCVEIHQRSKDTWYMDNVSLFENRSSCFSQANEEVISIYTRPKKFLCIDFTELPFNEKH